MKNLFTLIAVAALVGCATTSSTPVGQVQEVGPGTYKIAFSHTSETVFTGHSSTYGVVDQAGQYCHAKGKKLLVVPSKESGVVVFRCEGEMDQQPVTPNAGPIELRAQTKGAGQN
jgi:putative hemolysin